MSPAPELVVVEGVWRDFLRGSETVHALAGIDLSIGSGEYIGLAGRSGSGKSTLLHLLGCLDRPTRGRILFEGQDCSRFSDRRLVALRREQMGFVFQAFHLVPHLTALENVALPLRYRGVARAERLQRAAAALAQVGLTHRTRHEPRQLSGGEAQRVSLARAIVTRPHLLLADEPTGELDTTTAGELGELLDGLRQADPRMTLVVATHDEALLERTTRVVKLVDGQLQGCGGGERTSGRDSHGEVTA